MAEEDDLKRSPESDLTQAEADYMGAVVTLAMLKRTYAENFARFKSSRPVRVQGKIQFTTDEMASHQAYLINGVDLETQAAYVNVLEQRMLNHE